MKKINISYKLFRPFLLAIIFIGAFLVLTFLQKGKAELVTVIWDFNTPGEYTYDQSKIIVADGMARRIISPDISVDFTPLASPAGGPGSQTIPPTFCFDTIESTNSVALPQESQLQGASEVTDLNGGMTGYQISIDGNTWLYWNGFEWVSADSYSFSPIQDINTNIGLLPHTTQLKFKARLAGDCSTSYPNLIDLTFTYSFTLPGYAITTNTPGLTITDESGELLSRTENSFYARINNLPILFATPADNIDLTLPAVDHVVLASTSLFAAWVDIPATIRNSFTSWEILLQKSVTATTPVSIRVCPNVLSIEMLSSSCADGVTLSSEVPSQGDYTLTSLDDPLFWHLRSVSSVDSFALYEFSPYTSPIVSGTTATKNNTDVLLAFTVQDAESHNVTISNLQYSTTGAWQGEEHSISSINNGNGLTELTSSSEGVPHTIVWNAKTDLGNTNNTTVYIRMTVADSFSPGVAVVFDPISLDFSPPAPRSRSAKVSVPVDTPTIELPPPSVVTSIVPSEVTPLLQDSKVITKKPSNKKEINTLQVIRQIEESKETPFLKTPEIIAIKQVAGRDTISFSGKGIPNSTVTLFIHSDQLVFYTTQVAQDGTWNIVHEQDSVILSEGEHSVYAITYDSHSAVRSAPTKPLPFSVERNMAAAVLAHVNVRFTIVTLSILTLVLMIFNRYKRLYK